MENWMRMHFNELPLCVLHPCRITHVVSLLLTIIPCDSEETTLPKKMSAIERVEPLSYLPIQWQLRCRDIFPQRNLRRRAHEQFKFWGVSLPFYARKKWQTLDTQFETRFCERPQMPGVELPGIQLSTEWNWKCVIMMLVDPSFHE